jgi:hypothetical protein
LAIISSTKLKVGLQQRLTVFLSLVIGGYSADSFLGMFLWVRLVMQGLENCYSPQDLIDAVHALPEGLDEA